MNKLAFQVQIKICLLLFIVSLFFSCRSQKDVIYFQESPSSASKSRISFKNFPEENDESKIQTYEPVIRSNDILKIYVSSINREASSFFNPLMNPDSKVDDPSAFGYLVDAKGFIEMPLIGQIKVSGLTVNAIRDTVKQKLSKYLENPTVRIIFDNFKVSVLGEVNRPGVYVVQNERLTLPEALGLAGDLTIFGNRRNILVIREDEGKREFSRVDLTLREIFKNPFYFLHPNDVIYIEPVKSKTAVSDNFYRIFPIVISSITLISILLIRFNQVK